MMRLETLEEIEAEAPVLPDYGDKPQKMAFWGACCTWWTTDLAKAAKRAIIPLCPLCGSPLFQGPLDRFLECARAAPETYGPLGLDALALAHADNRPTNCREWTKQLPEGQGGLR